MPDPRMIALPCVGLITGLLFCVKNKSKKKEHQTIKVCEDCSRNFDTVKRGCDAQGRTKVAKKKRDVESVERGITPGETLIPEEELGCVLCEKKRLQREKEQLEGRIQTHDTVLNNMKREWDGQIRRKLADVEEKKEKNKREVESVESLITLRETLKIPEELLRQKEELLQAQWKLDAKQREYEKQLIGIEKMTEPLMSHMTSNTNRDQADQEQTN